MKRFKVLAEYDPDKPIVEQLLDIRGITDSEEKRLFLDPPPLKDLVKKLPGELKNSLGDAKDLIKECMDREMPIVVYGDYDADGVCATTILYSTIKDELGYLNVSYFIPNRFDHGYGMTIEALDEILAGNAGEKVLFISVDTGITALDEVKYLKSLGHKVIITDHHQKPEGEMTADVVVWYDQIVGATVSWLLSKVLGSKNVSNLCFAALATITDLQTVLGFNRSIVKKGLEVMNVSPPIGLKALIDISGRTENEITTYDLGWVLGPRLNATGRLISADDAIALLLEKDMTRALELASTLNEVNNQRQDMTTEMYEIASLDENAELPRIIFSTDEEYHEGIIGLVAAKLVQKYYRPSIVISLSDGHGKGSVRSIPGVNIIEMLRNFEDLFVNVGGHPMAAGFTIKTENISEFQEKMLVLAAEQIDEELFIPELEIDMIIPIEEADLELLTEIEKMRPFGLGNSEPLFISYNVGVLDYRYVGRENNHVLFKFYDKGKHYKGIWFNSAERVRRLGFGDKIDVVYSLKRNDYNGRTYVDLFVKDIKA